MYNRYIPTEDGQFRRQQVQNEMHSSVPEPSKPVSASVAQTFSPSVQKKTSASETEELLLIIILLLLLTDDQDEDMVILVAALAFLLL